VGVKIDEEIEKLNSDGTSDGYSATEPDPARASEVLDKIQISLNSAHP
jgi:hypothetical protein